MRLRVVPTIFVVSALLVPGIVFAPAAGAATTCGFSPSTHVLSVSVEGDSMVAQIARNGDFITVNGNTCLGGFLVASTVHNTDLVVVNGGPGNQFVSISTHAGRLRPGFTNEPGSSDEIEVEVALKSGTGDSLAVGGGTGRDLIRFGGSGTPRINLNANEGTGVDTDITTAGVETHSGSGGAGNDVIAGTGGAGTGGEAQYRLALTGSIGNDKLTGGDAADNLSDSAPPMSPENDADVLKGRGGPDFLSTSDGDTLDLVVGGAGIDICSTDAGDQVKTC